MVGGVAMLARRLRGAWQGSAGALKSLVRPERSMFLGMSSKLLRRSDSRRVVPAMLGISAV